MIGCSPTPVIGSLLMVDTPHSHPVLKRGKTPADGIYLQRVGDRVRAMRDTHGLTRKKLSEISGVSERYLADLEAGSGNASLLVLRRVAAALQLNLAELVSEQPPHTPDMAAIVQQLETMSPSEIGSARQLLQRIRLAPPQRHAGRIALIGLRGAGKSTIGRAAATAMDLPFVELDREIERATGMELSEIFAGQGKAGYRQHELRCLQALVRQHDRAVIATGGSLVTEPAAYELLLSTCFVVWLKASPQSHMERVMAQGDLRPMADNPAAMDDLRAILTDREALYARAHAMIDTSSNDRQETVDQLLELARNASRSAQTVRVL